MFKYYFNRGLDSVEALAQLFSSRVWWLPDLICPEVLEVIRRYVGRLEFYHINEDFSWAVKIADSEPKVFFSIDYFGKETDVGCEAPPNTIIIRDSVWFPYPFSPVRPNQIWFNSLRKIFHGQRGIKGSSLISPYRIPAYEEVPNIFNYHGLTWTEMNKRFENYHFCKEIFSKIAIKGHNQEFPSIFPIRLPYRERVLAGIDTPLPGMWADVYDLNNILYKELIFVPLDSRFNTDRLAELADKILRLA